MAGDGDSPDNHVFNVRNNSLRYVKDLLRENERLRDITTSLECDRLEIENQLVATRAELDTQAKNRCGDEGHGPSRQCCIRNRSVMPAT